MALVSGCWSSERCCGRSNSQIPVCREKRICHFYSSEAGLLISSLAQYLLFSFLPGLLSHRHIQGHFCSFLQVFAAIAGTFYLSPNDNSFPNMFLIIPTTLPHPILKYSWWKLLFPFGLWLPGWLTIGVPRHWVCSGFKYSFTFRCYNSIIFFITFFILKYRNIEFTSFSVSTSIFKVFHSTLGKQVLLLALLLF